MILVYVNLLLCLGSTYAKNLVCHEVNVTIVGDAEVNCHLSEVGIDAVANLKIFHEGKQVLKFDKFSKIFISYNNKNKITLNVEYLLGKLNFECQASFGTTEYIMPFYLELERRASFRQKKKLANQELVLNENGIIAIDLDVGSDTPSVKWFRVNIETNDLISLDLIATDTKRITISFDGVYISPVVRSDAGKYLAMIRDSAHDSFETMVIVNEKPHVKFEPVLSAAIDNMKYEILFNLKGVPIPVITLLKKGQFIMNRNSSIDKRISFVQDHIISLDPVLLKDNGEYELVAKNSLGQYNIKLIIVVNIPPRNVVFDQPVYTVTVPFKSYIECNCEALPVATMYIYRNNLPSVHYTKDSVMEGITINYAKNILRIIFDPTSYIHASNYTCRVSNIYGHASNESYLNLHYRMKPIKSLSAIKVTPSTILFKVKLPDHYNPNPPIAYVTIYSKHSQQRFPIKFFNNVYLYKNLVANKTYSFNAKLSNELHPGDVCRICQIYVSTPPIRKPYPVIIISKPESNEYHSYQLTWDRIFTGGSGIKRIYVKTRRVIIYDQNDIWSVEEYIDQIWNVNEISENLEDIRGFYIAKLQSSSFYKVEVIFENKLGKSDPNAEFIFKTKSYGDKKKEIGTNLNEANALYPQTVCYVILVLSFTIMNIL